MRKFKIKYRDNIKIELGEYETVLMVDKIGGKLFLRNPKNEIKRSACYAKRAISEVSVDGLSGVVNFESGPISFHLEDRIGSAKHNMTFFYHDVVDNLFVEKLSTGHKVLNSHPFGEKEDGAWMSGCHSAIY